VGAMAAVKVEAMVEAMEEAMEEARAVVERVAAMEAP